ncbi:TMEM43 family protein [uncultured Gimesia sp.]|uniref:TMEM43 family protein n=1 Tax=uncultured Gimesia sp. TaxID=1678688 RepID=UPI0030DC9E5E|tara:strand:+ start:268333 stop:268890 length:558 start_codon:yes stop_codon:yes gene_type:complete
MNQKTETNSANSFSKRFKTALKNLGVGIVFMIAGLFLLWHNETTILDRELNIEQAQSVISETQKKSSENEAETPVGTQNLQSTTGWNWGFRMAGWVILFLGLATLFKPLVVLVEKIPLLSNFVGRGITLFALLSSLSLTLILMSAVWMVARPVFGAVLLLSGVIPLLVLYRSGKRAKLKQALKQA